MTMFLTLLLVAASSLVVTCLLAFGVSPQERERRARAAATPALRPEERLVATPPQFFAPEVREIPTRPQVPIEVLMSQLQRHVQLEQAAAETFANGPSPESLHSRTSSPFVN